MKHHVLEERWQKRVAKDPHLCTTYLADKCLCKGKCKCHYVYCEDPLDPVCDHKWWNFLYTTITKNGLETVVKCRACGYYLVAYGHIIADDEEHNLK